MILRGLTLLLVLILRAGASAHGQAVGGLPSCAPAVLDVTGLTDGSADYARLAELTGVTRVNTAVVRRMGTSSAPLACPQRAHPWARRVAALPMEATWEAPLVRLLPATTRGVMNSAWARTHNDGALWAGRGLSGDVSAGAAASWGVFTAAVAPVLAYQQNRAFDIHTNEMPGFSPFAYPFHAGAAHLYIDWPQRFGDDPFWTLQPGQSYVRADAFGVAIGASTENMWWGPGIRNAIMMSNTAAGFPHAFVGTSGPANIGIGRLDVHAVWGRLEASDYFELGVPRAHQLFAGLTVGIEPRGLPGLVIGGTRVFNRRVPPDGLEFGDYFPFLQGLLKRSLQSPGNPRGDTPTDEIASVFFRWVLPESGFEVYGELARTDHALDLNDLIQEPDHSRAYTLGLQKVVDVRGRRWLRLGGETTALGGTRVSTFRSTGGAIRFYAHDKAYQGYTHRGQLLGAGIGPGSDAQTIWADLYSGSGRTGILAERVRYDDDAYARHFAPVYTFTGHDVELTAGLSHTHFLGPVDLGLAVALSDRRNRNFLRCNDREGPLQYCRSNEEREANWQVRLHGTWWPDLLR